MVSLRRVSFCYKMDLNPEISWDLGFEIIYEDTENVDEGMYNISGESYEILCIFYYITCLFTLDLYLPYRTCDI